ncbi:MULTISPECIES: hypothetical protein [Streptacidiphilus]|uniref:Restriction endonuclease type IV Mrr domain-containing protein n=1 Tax=Streptacidiphilus cavernicola TaxID=3342716 RepID=A0ABV6V144_9ACTN|nr:hypothetical protein [Streptacidiphilus jeojiense]
MADIEVCWASGGFEKAHAVEAGERVRSRAFDAYAGAVNWSDEDQVAAALLVFERMLRKVRGEDRQQGRSVDDFQEVRRAFAEDGYQITEGLQILRFGAERPEHATSAGESYASALRILRNARNQIERSPRLTELLDEELIRDVLLVALNGHFEGRSTGETTNHRGKTDILVRISDLNVLVAECKVWRGRQGVLDALTQLLGYLSWADTHAALLIFIRTGNPGETVAKAVSALEQHSAFLRVGSVDENARQVNVVVQSPVDAAKEVEIALIPFVIASLPR